MKPLFSFIVPVHNIEKFLPKCIESILGQTYTDFELILVDDGSTDSSGKICDQYAAKDKRIIVIHKENERQGVARKVACERALGEYIIPVDGDDWIDTKLLTVITQIISQYKPDIICYSALRTADEGKSGFEIKWTISPGLYEQSQIINSIFPHLIRDIKGKYLFPSVWGKVFKKDLFLPYQKTIDPRIVIGEDAAVTYACVMHAKSVFVSSEKLYYYRINPTSTSRARETGYPWGNPHWVHQCTLRHLDINYDFDSQLNRRICHELFNVIISHLQTNRPYKEAKKEILAQITLPENQKAIQKSTFSFPCQDWVAQFALKYKLIFLMKFYAWVETKFIKK